MQVVSSCDLTSGEDSEFEIVDGAGSFVYRLEGDDISMSGLDTLDAGHSLTVTNTGNGEKGESPATRKAPVRLDRGLPYLVTGPRTRPSSSDGPTSLSPAAGAGRAAK